MASKDVQSGGVMLAEGWKLYPVDDRNWELCQLRECSDSARSRRSGNAGRVMWFRCGRFYSSATVEHAMLYVMDELWKASLGDEARGLAVALANYRALLAEARDVAGSVAGAMETTPSPLGAGDRDGGPQGGE